MNSKQDIRAGGMAHKLNILALYGVSLVLAIAFYYQLVHNDLPCPLCLLQRAAFVLFGIGLLLNLRFKSSPLHYGMMIVSALAGMLASGRQMLLHIAPGTGTYGSALFGLHFYTLAFIAFLAGLLYTGLLLMLEGREQVGAPTAATAQTGPQGTWVRGAAWLFALLVTLNTLSTFLECGLGQCEDNPTQYMLLQLLGR